jgi:hypothetical protein
MEMLELVFHLSYDKVTNTNYHIWKHLLTFAEKTLEILFSQLAEN